MKRKFKAGTTSVMLPIRVRDSSSTTGAYLGGLAYNTLNLAAKYRRQGDANWTTITLVNATAGTFTSGGFCAAGSAPTGAYELHVPNAAFASGAEWVEIELYGASNMVPVSIEIELDVVDYQTAAFGALTTLGTNAPANWLNAAAFADGALTAAKFASGAFDAVWAVTSRTLSSAGVQAIWDAATSALTTVGSIGKRIVDYLTGDTYTRLGAPAGASVSADISTLLGRLTSSRAGYLDNLNVGGAVASQADVTALNQSASRRVILTTVGQYERPESGSSTYTVEARTYDGDGAATNADSTPTLTATGSVTGDLSANLSVASNPSTGVYRWTYTVANDATLEQVRHDLSATIGGSTFPMSVYTQVADFVAATFTTADRTKLEAIHGKLPSKSYLTGSNNSDGDIQLSEATGGLPADSITASSYDESTAFPVVSADSGSTRIARTGADSDTLESLSDQLDAINADTAAILLDTGTDGVVVAAGSKTGYSLASTGLDSIAVTAPSGVASTFPAMVVQLWRRFFKKATKTSTQIKTYADDGTTVVTTQTVSDDGTTETQGAAS